MARFYLCFLLAVPFAVSAQGFDFGKLSEMMGDPEKMQQEAEKLAKSIAEATSCIDVEAMKRMQAEGEAMDKQVRALCAKGDRKGAEKAVVDYSKKLLASQDFKKLKECGQEMMAHLPKGYAEAGDAEASKTGSGGKEQEVKHVCDTL